MLHPHKVSPGVPNSLCVTIACAKIERWAERNYPPPPLHPRPACQVWRHPGASSDLAGARSPVAHADAETDRRATDEKRCVKIHERVAAGGVTSASRSL